ncbi:hypothetical protein [Georgenia sp. AZ-5]|uniref:hypothetical protein n=1 Tax=Georgenia sp. AZ-5 TaxID=3367526 RepID=UPI00375514E8
MPQKRDWFWDIWGMGLYWLLIGLERTVLGDRYADTYFTFLLVCMLVTVALVHVANAIVDGRVLARRTRYRTRDAATAPNEPHGTTPPPPGHP